LAADFEALKPFPSADPPGRAEQPRPDPAAEPSGRPGLVAPGGRFLVMAGLQLERSNQEVHCRVVLMRGTAAYQGEAREMDTPTGRARAAARATLAAAEYACPGITLGLEGVAIVDLFSRRYVAASVEAAQARNYALLAGLVTLENNRAIEDAAVLATLRAIDRWLAQ
jgi:hypothetical protein